MRIRLLFTALAVGAMLAAHPGGVSATPTAFDLQAHRGGLGLTAENTLPAFARSLEIGVTTLELDIQITRDGREIIGHDAKIDGSKCTDTEPVSPGDSQYPYVGKLIKDLSFEQVRTVNCGSKMPTLEEVFTLASDRGADTVQFSIELKTDPRDGTTAPREQFIQRAVQEVQRAGVRNRTIIQSFDWATLKLVRQHDSGIRLYALTDPTKVYPFSPWLGGLDLIWESGSLVNGAKSIGATALSPMHALPPDGSVQLPAVSQRLVDTAHENGILVVPWVVNQPGTMHELMDKGVDGIITDYPDRLREVMRERGLSLPPAYPQH
ncbi:glycerophosphodiester phosphodiesterase family protein [Nocardia uniformis]|uniref:glycerophosphodiester phosphodiesterase family protein n=1 Tax=Nocardia uniformis TaxID=53432 RepID=UPI000B1E198E|nr:glycerophosphodiester phosphodiesterase family protein [Nocardia uniformis]